MSWQDDLSQVLDVEAGIELKGPVYVVRPANEGPYVWCSECKRPITEETDHWSDLVNDVREHTRLNHAR